MIRRTAYRSGHLTAISDRLPGVAHDRRRSPGLMLYTAMVQCSSSSNWLRVASEPWLAVIISEAPSDHGKMPGCEVLEPTPNRTARGDLYHPRRYPSASWSRRKASA